MYDQPILYPRLLVCGGKCRLWVSDGLGDGLFVRDAADLATRHEYGLLHFGRGCLSVMDVLSFARILMI